MTTEDILTALEQEVSTHDFNNILKQLTYKQDLSDKNKVVFYPIKKEIDTIDGMWVSGLPDEVRLIITGQEYITVGQFVEIE